MKRPKVRVLPANSIVWKKLAIDQSLHQIEHLVHEMRLLLREIK